MQYRNVQYPGVQYPWYGWNSPYHNQQQIRADPKQKSTETQGHVHPYYGLTTIQDNHAHMHPGVTSTPIETEKGHVHKIYGITTFQDGHIHRYEAYTSPPIPLPNGYHTHYVEIKTTEDDGHIHVIKGYVKATEG